MDPFPEQSHRISRKGPPQGRGGPTRFAAPDRKERPVVEGAHLFRRPRREELPAVEETDATAPLCLVEVGGGEEDRNAPSEEPVQDLPEVPPGDGVHPAG